MRARRRFQPMLDSMPIRIAPSSISGFTPTLVHSAPTSSPTPPRVIAQDTLMPESGKSSPIILEPVTTPPSTLPC
jgi:hypothetical protein